MVSRVTSDKNLYNLIQPKVSKSELGGLCLNELFKTEYKSFKVLPLTATDLTKEKPQQFVYKIWKKTIEVTVTLTEPCDDSFIGKIEWNTGGIYLGKICKLRVEGKDPSDVFETVIPYADHKHPCEIIYRTKSYRGMLEHHLMKNSKILTFIGNGQINENIDNYQGSVGLDLFSGEFYPKGEGKIVKDTFVFEGNFFYWHDFQGRAKELQLYAKGKLTNTIDGNQYSGSLLYSSAGFTLVSLPKNDDRFEIGTFSIGVIDEECPDPDCKDYHFQKISSGELISKPFSNENYLFGINGVTRIYDPETMECVKEVVSEFLVLPKTLSTLLPTEDGKFLQLKIEDQYTYYGTFSIKNFEPLGSGLISFANTNIYHGKVIFSPDGTPHILPVDSEEYEISIDGVKKSVKKGHGTTTTEHGSNSDYFYFDNKGNIYTMAQVKASLKVLPSKSSSFKPSHISFSRATSPAIEDYNRRHSVDEKKSISSQQDSTPSNPNKSNPNRRPQLKERPPFSFASISSTVVEGSSKELTGANVDSNSTSAAQPLPDQ